jgi:LPPG:FO 2-phospho-L-lactate transferase
VGGAKLGFGLGGVLPPEALTLVVNTGDDFVHLGLHVSADLDTVVYTLANLADRERGWGLAGETWNFMNALGGLGGETWFNLGDRDLATHVERTRRLAGGQTLSDVTAALAAAVGLRHAIVPMSDDAVRTVIQTAEGELEFQRYFVAEQCRPVATGVRFEGAARAQPSPRLAAALARDDISAVLLCPSNPHLSIGPILAVPGVREGLKALGVPVVAVSPLVGGLALKGPAAKLMAELGFAKGVAGIARIYEGLITGLVVDEADAADAAHLAADGLPTLSLRTVMATDEDRVRLARETLEFAWALGREQSRASA